MTTLKDVRAIGASLYRDGVMTGAQLHLPKADYDALALEVDRLLTFEPQPQEQPPPARPAPEWLRVRTVCGEILVTSPPDCEHATTIFRGRA